MRETSDLSHVAIIMDGNGRWAKRQGLARVRGHEAGVESVRTTVRSCARRDLSQLTLYAFSAENWKRPRTEVSFLMSLLERFLVDERGEIMENNVRLTSIGRVHELSRGVQRELEKTTRMSSENTGLNLCLALNYGGRTELVDAARRIAEAVEAGSIRSADVDEAMIHRFLYQPEMPDPDLLIRTAGEMRLSNFLLWECSYTEIFVTPVCWPEFREKELEEAFRVYGRRTRTYGGLWASKKSKAADPSGDSSSGGSAGGKRIAGRA